MANLLLGFLPGFSELLDVANFTVDAVQLLILRIGVDVVQCVLVKC